MALCSEKLRTIALQHIRARAFDKNLENGTIQPKDGWRNDRTASEILTDLYGIQASFDYIRATFQNQPQVLFVGESVGNGIAELQKQYIAEGINFFATSLRRTPTIISNIGLDHLFFTSAEQMKGIPEHSMHGVFSLFGISYADPEFAMRGVDHVLSDGGIFKASFCEDTKFGSQKATDFVEALDRIGGYGIHVHEETMQIVVAIKNRSNNLALDILIKDHASFFR